MKRHTRNPQDFLTKWGRQREEAIKALIALRAEVIGAHRVGEMCPRPDFTAWMDTLPEHPRSARERFLQIIAFGGPIPFEALSYKLAAQPHRRFRNWWHVYLRSPHGIGGPRVEMWIGSRRRIAEVYEDQLRQAACIFKGTLAECFQFAHAHLAVEDASERLGGDR